MKQGHFEPGCQLENQADAASRLLQQVRAKGCRLWSANGSLHYAAPKGVLSPDEIRHLREYRDLILARLQCETIGVCCAGSTPGSLPTRASLSYSQQAHWHMFKLGERRHLRQIASATRLCGRLDVGALREALDFIVSRHETLRTRFVFENGTPAQEVLAWVEPEFQVHDFIAAHASERDMHVHRMIEQHILSPVEITAGPLLGVCVLKLDSQQHVLILAMEHSISDGYSRNILTRDLFAAYAQICDCRRPSLPQIPMQFAQYTREQRRSEKKWIEEHGCYWSKRLQGCGRVRFPEDVGSSKGTQGWGAAPLLIERDLKAALIGWCRKHQSTLPLAVLTAYVALVMRWCDSSDVVIRYQTDGRISPDIQNAIGFFAFALHLRIELHREDTFLTLLRRVTEEYLNAYVHADFCYIDAQLPRPDVSRTTVFNWQSHSLQSRDEVPALTGRLPDCTAIPFVHPMMRTLDWDGEPSIMLFDARERIEGTVYFPMSRFSYRSMERFGHYLVRFAEALLAEPKVRVASLQLA